MKKNILAIKGIEKLSKKEQQHIKGGAPKAWGHSYKCGDGTGFSTVGPNPDTAEAISRCGRDNYTVTPIYVY